MAELSNGVPKAIDLSHHVNARSKARHPSPLKDILKYMAYDDMVSLAGGLPHPSLFPIHDIVIAASSPKDTSRTATVNLHLSNHNGRDVPLSKFLQYGNCAGNDALRKWCFEFTERVCRPAYKDFQILLHPGNTNGWSKVVGLLCEDGDYILCESFTYPSAQARWIPEGYHAAALAMDDQGIRADVLEATLSRWGETHPGVRRPHLLYLVSVGSNPSGVTTGAQRRQEIYDICVKYDVIIIEDDPYYFIQYPAYEIGTTSEPSKALSNDDFLSSLAPSFLHYDYQGRVIRLDSFSKTLAPGLRLGWFVANPVFTERLLRASEVETQDPSGLSQAVVLSLLEAWTMDGYLTWLQNLRLEYQIRRDWMLDAFARHFTLLPVGKSAIRSASGVVASMRHSDGAGSTPIFSFVPPTGGMFIWTDIYLAENPRYKEIQSDPQVPDPEQTVAGELWMKLVEESVLLTPGSYYHPWLGHDHVTTKAREAPPGMCNFRFSFAMVTKTEMELGIARFAKVVRSCWGI